MPAKPLVPASICYAQLWLDLIVWNMTIVFYLLVAICGIHKGRDTCMDFMDKPPREDKKELIGCFLGLGALCRL